MGGGQTDKSLSALGAERAFQEIQLSACSGELAASGRLGIFLSHQIQLYASVNTDDVFHPADTLRRVNVIYVSRAKQLRLLV